MKFIFFIFFFFIAFSIHAQKDSLQLGSRYAEDQIYASVSYAQLTNQPSGIIKSGFSYAFSVGFIKDFTLNRKGTFAFALGLGYGYDFFNHTLKVHELDNKTTFDFGANLSSNTFSYHNLEVPIEFRWRTSTANKYDFWRIYTGVKFLYNLNNNFKYTENNTLYSFNSISNFRKLQYGLTFSFGFDEYNFNLFYSLSPLFENATIQGEGINTSVLKFGFIFYIL